MNNKIKILLSSVIFAIIFVFPVFVLLAADSNPSLQYPWQSITNQTPAGWIGWIYSFSLIIVGACALGVIIFAGIKYTVSAGNVSARKDAVSMITSAILGIVLLLGAYIVLNTINPKLTRLENPNLQPAHVSSKGSVITGCYEANIPGVGLVCLKEIGGHTCISDRSQTPPGAWDYCCNSATHYEKSQSPYHKDCF